VGCAPLETGANPISWRMAPTYHDPTEGAGIAVRRALTARIGGEQHGPARAPGLGGINRVIELTDT